VATAAAVGTTCAACRRSLKDGEALSLVVDITESTTPALNAALATEAIRLLAGGLNRWRLTPATCRAGNGCWAARSWRHLLRVSGAGLHHKICHVLGGRFNLQHAQTHAVMLPHVTAFNVAATPAVVTRLATALGSSGALAGLARLYKTIDAPRSLAGIGFSEDEIPEAVNLIMPHLPPSNPRRVDAADLERLLDSAWKGKTPWTVWCAT
jgi:maleylacetate reductase